MNCYKCQTPIPDNSRFCSACGADVSGDSHAHTDTITDEQGAHLFNMLQGELGDEYILERELGRGGMAVVFLGHDARLGRKVAVKVLPPELTYGGGSMIERFKREAQTAAKLDHPYIIPVYRVSPGGRLFWYVMKYLDGEALDDVLEREGQLTVERTVEIVRQVAEALDYAHQNKVVHRDVKPANVVVDAKGRVTVTDFGIAKALDANTLTASGSIIGTPYYMSPEQCKGKRVGPAADQYSLAVMTYQMLGGHLPFTGDSAVEIVHKHVADPVPPLGVLRPQLPAKVVEVVERGLAKAPEQRFATVAEFARVLQAAAQGLDVTVAPPGKPVGVRVSATALISPVPGALRTATRGWKRTGLWVGGGLVGVAAVVVLVVLPRLGARAPTPPVSPQDTARQVAVAPPTGTLAGDTAKRAMLSADTTPARLAPGPTGPAKRPTAAERRATRPPASTTPGRPVVPTQAAQQTAPPAPQAAPTQAPVVTPPAAATARITIGSLPATATMYINGQPVARNPVSNYEVPAGSVTVRFVVTDSTSGASWERTFTYNVPAGETLRVGRVTLKRS